MDVNTVHVLTAEALRFILKSEWKVIQVLSDPSI